MFRKSVSSLILVAFTTMLFSSCSGDGSLNPGDSSTDEGGDLEEVLRTDTDVQELMDVDVQLLERALHGGVNSAQLRYALETEDKEYVAALFGFSVTELEKVEAKILQLCEAVSERYPEIRERAMEMSATSCQSCDVETFLDKWDEVLAVYNPEIDKSSCVDPAMCRIVPMVTGLIMCAYTLGATVVGYLACAYVVVCSYCEGGWADLICG